MSTPLQQPFAPEAQAALDRVLQALEHRQHSATEMRVLLRLLECRDASIAELAERLEIRPTEVTRAGRRLAMRGLVRTHHAGKREQMLMQITRSGRVVIRSLLTAAERESVRPSTPQEPLDGARKRRGSTVEEMGEGSFPASDPPAAWTWEVGETSPPPRRAGAHDRSRRASRPRRVHFRAARDGR
jgi:DNA-binding MarR family transcriptional regulator